MRNLQYYCFPAKALNLNIQRVVRRGQVVRAEDTRMRLIQQVPNFHSTRDMSTYLYRSQKRTGVDYSKMKIWRHESANPEATWNASQSRPWPHPSTRYPIASSRMWDQDCALTPSTCRPHASTSGRSSKEFGINLLPHFNTVSTRMHALRGLFATPNSPKYRNGVRVHNARCPLHSYGREQKQMLGTTSTAEGCLLAVKTRRPAIRDMLNARDCTPLRQLA